MNKKKMKLIEKYRGFTWLISLKQLTFQQINQVKQISSQEVVRLLKQVVVGYIINEDSLNWFKFKAQLKNLRNINNLMNTKQRLSSNWLINKKMNLSVVEQHLLRVNYLYQKELKPIFKHPLKHLKKCNQCQIGIGWKKVANLKVEYERKQVYTDRLATQIQAVLAQQAKSKIILKESEHTLDQAQTHLETKRAQYAEAKRDQENVIIKQVANWSGR